MLQCVRETNLSRSSFSEVWQAWVPHVSSAGLWGHAGCPLHRQMWTDQTGQPSAASCPSRGFLQQPAAASFINLLFPCFYFVLSGFFFFSFGTSTLSHSTSLIGCHPADADGCLATCTPHCGIIWIVSLTQKSLVLHLFIPPCLLTWSRLTFFCLYNFSFWNVI
jgi:hypothetical protein